MAARLDLLLPAFARFFGGIVYSYGMSEKAFVKKGFSAPEAEGVNTFVGLWVSVEPELIMHCRSKGLTEDAAGDAVQEIALAV